MSALAQAVRAVALPAFVGEAGVRREHQARRLLGGVAMLLGVAAPAGALLSALALPIVLVLYGTPWTASAAALASLAVFGALRTVLDLFATFLTARGATKGLLLVQAIWMVALLPGLFLGARVGGLAGVGWAHVVVTVVVALPCYLVCLRRQDVRAGEVLQASLVPLAVAGAVGVAASLATNLAGPAWAKLAVGCLAGGLVWVAGLGRWMLRRVRVREVQPVAVA
jgi:PST family polysaccharide transporter